MELWEGTKGKNRNDCVPGDRQEYMDLDLLWRCRACSSFSQAWIPSEHWKLRWGHQVRASLWSQPFHHINNCHLERAEVDSIWESSKGSQCQSGNRNGISGGIWTLVWPQQKHISPLLPRRLQLGNGARKRVTPNTAKAFQREDMIIYRWKQNHKT